MDSGLALRAPRNDEVWKGGRKAQYFVIHPQSLPQIDRLALG